MGCGDKAYRDGHLICGALVLCPLLQMHKKTAKSIHIFISYPAQIQSAMPLQGAFGYICHEYCTQSRSTTLLQDKAKVHTLERGSPPSFVPIIVESTSTVHAHQEAAELIAVFLTIHATVFSRALFVEKHEPRVGPSFSRPIVGEMKPFNISREISNAYIL